MQRAYIYPPAARRNFLVIPTPSLTDGHLAMLIAYYDRHRSYQHADELADYLRERRMARWIADWRRRGLSPREILNEMLNAARLPDVREL
jgi:hypothetical protein